MVRIAAFPLDTAGHANPMLAIVTALAARGVETVGAGPPPLRAALEAAGVQRFVATPAADGTRRAFAEFTFLRPVNALRAAIGALADCAPDLVLHDVFDVAGALAGRALGRPSVGLVTMPGYGALPRGFAAENAPGRHPAVLAANRAYARALGVDLLAEGRLAALFPGTAFDLVSTPALLHRPLGADAEPELLGALEGRGPEVVTGACAGPARLVPDRTVPDAAAVGAASAGLRAGRHVVLASLGTVLTGRRFVSPVAGAPTGEAFLRRVLAGLIAAFADAPDIVLIAATGPRLDRTAFGALSGNVVLAPFLPLPALLRTASVFVTHHGANATAEALAAGVPMVALPGAGDQIANACRAVALGVSHGPWDLAAPYGALTPESLGGAVRHVLASARMRARAATLAAEVAAEDGAAAAARHLLALAATTRGWNRCATSTSAASATP